MNQWGIKIPSILIDPITCCFTDDPKKCTSFPNKATIDRKTIIKSFMGGSRRNPLIGTNLYKMENYPSAEKLQRAWKRLAMRLTVDFRDYVEYKEKEQLLMCKYFLSEMNPDHIFDFYVEVAWKHEEI
ncbi:hypothetical protein EDEG_04169 [Edhazardia aedis USNM 41457]|uniref:Uncharacterized protein n=1 Tax=Edhazardia aedis (strain USNM 41457) TaxID=1003232 RepID=J9DUD9_EDHAE|nr:hypothetical protein EDEG_04169 [Edhazardia aedis USNM 41457]|eukprot:EJW04912.1 hypothetical protein EDEG_04169 [Edhazardia aedis USNM 41457]